jgi:hypothetical protein
MKTLWLRWRGKHINSYFRIDRSIVGGYAGHQWHWNKRERRFIDVGVSTLAAGPGSMLHEWKRIKSPPKRIKESAGSDR